MTEEPFYKSITGYYEPKAPAKNVEEWKKADTKQINKVLEENDVGKRVIETDGSQEVYPKWLVRSLVAVIFILLAGVVIFGIFVYKYEPARIDQPISVNPNVTVEGDTVNVDANDEINPSFYNDNQATIIIEKIEVTCVDGGCIGEGGGNSSA